MVVIGLVGAHWLRFSSGLIPRGIEQDIPLALPSYWSSGYWKLTVVGAVIVFLGLLGKGICQPDDLFAPRRIRARLTGVVVACLAVFLGLSLAVRTVPSISRAFVLCAAGCIISAVYTWRALLALLLRRSALSRHLRQRLLAVGCNPDACRIRRSARGNPQGAVDFVGCVGRRPANATGDPECLDLLGPIQQFETILQQQAVDAVALVDSDLAPAEVVQVANQCERHHVELKIVPHQCLIMVSRLRPTMIAGVPLLGIEALPLNQLGNWVLKRGVDIIGALVGLLVSAPLMAAFGALVFLESPGPIIYRQLRMGRGGRLFTMYKLRSMRLDAETDGAARWAQPDDPRRLRIGAFLRKWNIDEVPQFWNVLKGDMSLVGPRPERPEFVEKFKLEIPHYNVRHSCLPGLTGWAQVNGWRGNSSLLERIRHDIWYVEHWTIWLDFQIMLQTFYRRKNAY